MSIINRILALGIFMLLAGCSGMVGAYRGPEPFGGKQYLVAPPPVRLAVKTKVVLLLLKDERPKLDRELDWVRQSRPMGDTKGQPVEVRQEFDRAIRSGLTTNRGIALVSPEVFSRTRDADLVISGRILRCDAEKKMGWTTADFHGQAIIEITVRDGRGKTVWPKPMQFTAGTVKKFSGKSLDFKVDEIPPGIASGVMEQAISQAVENFLTSKEFGAALQSAAAGP